MRISHLTLFLVTLAVSLPAVFAQSNSVRPEIGEDTPEFVNGAVEWIFNAPTHTKIADFRGDLLLVGYV